MLFRRLLKDQTIHYNNVINFNFGMSSFSNVIVSNHISFAFRILSLLFFFFIIIIIYFNMKSMLSFQRRTNFFIQT